jgi:hypothetical protein
MLKVEGSNSTELSPQFSPSLLKVVKLGHSASHSQADTVKVKECRIIYRRTGFGKSDDKSAPPTLMPTWYVDPNAVERRKSTETQEKAGPQGSRKAGGKPPVNAPG